MHCEMLCYLIGQSKSAFVARHLLAVARHGFEPGLSRLVQTE